MEILNFVKREVERRTGTTVEMSIVRNSFLFVLSSALGRKRFMVKKPDSSVLRYANFFAVTFANQGYGKDTSLNVCEEMFSEVFESYLPNIEQDFRRLTAGTPNDAASDDTNVIIPKQYKVALRGSIEGMMRVANFYNNTEIGSLNVVSTEFGHEITADTLSILMKLWQDGKSDGSTNVNEKYPPVNEVPTNILLFGSPEPFRRSKQKHGVLVEMITSGLGRRSNFSWTDFTPMEPAQHGDSEATVLKEYVQELGEMLNDIPSTIIHITPEAAEVANEFARQKIEEYNEDLSSLNNMFARMVDNLERTSALVAIANMNKNVTKADMEETINILSSSMDALKKVLVPPSAHKIMFSTAKNKNDYISIFDVEEYGVVFATKQDLAYQLELLEDYTRFKGMKLTMKGKRFKVEPLPETNLSKMLISISSGYNKHPEKATNFTPKEYPFFGDAPSIEALVQNPDIQSFCLSHFTPSASAPDGHRKAANHIQGQNLVAFDIDEGFSLNDAKLLLEKYTYIIYTTKSHQIEKNGIVTDRFRILLPTKTLFHVDPEQHKQLYENISEILELPIYDVSTRNVSRLWFTSGGCEVIKNEGDLFDANCCIPDTERSQVIVPNLSSLGNMVDAGDETARRKLGMQKYILMNTSDGNRNSMIMRYATFLIDIGEHNVLSECKYINGMLADPLTEHEVEGIVKKQFNR